MFSLPPDSTIINLELSYSMPVVWASIIAGIVGSFTALSCNARLGENSLISKNAWLFFASIAMGFGIWSMHFIGMSAIQLPVMMTHDMFLTFFSIIPAMIASLLAFYFVNQPRRTIRLYMLAGLVMGLGISSMHYIGMYGLNLDGLTYYYDPVIKLLSIIISIIVSFVALYIFSNAQTYMKKFSARIGTSIVLGFAVASMHYLGMYAMQFYVPNDAVGSHGMTEHMNAMNMAMITAGVSISVVVILLVLTLTTMVDKYLEVRVNDYDPLTKLPNRRSFQKVLEGYKKGKEHAHGVAIWHFQDIESYNQEHGYLFVDRLIRHISQYLIEHQPPLTELYRTEGNRFTYIAYDATAETELEREMLKMAEVFKNELIFEGKSISLQGMCAFVPSEQGLERLRKLYLKALAVLNHPSMEYKMNVTYYNPKFHTRNFTAEILEDFDEAMEAHDLFLVFQPKIDHQQKYIKSVEALIRWQHPNHGYLSPAIFLPILEANNRMSDLTDWVIVQACKELQVWKQDDAMPEQIAINIPGPYLTSNRLMTVLNNETKKYGILPTSIELEITETSFVKTIASAERAVHQFRNAGYSVALDDFGTGVSSLSYLKQIPITTLKIDKSFINDVPASEKDSSIIKSMIQLGKSLKMEVVVEGIETNEQATFLVKECGAPQMQGFYFAKPMRSDELIVWCRAFQIQMHV